MELKDLVGEHMLDGVDFCVTKAKVYGKLQNVDVMCFRLDGKIYNATENPKDGYRSSMNDLVISNDTIKNVFPPVKVIGRHRTKGKYNEDDVLELIDARTGKIVIEVGTCNIDYYYPSYIAFFEPKNMIINEVEKKSQR